jgi:pilus assembly protein Flp/PilA
LSIDTETGNAELDATPEPRSDRGASLVEYALLLALIAVVCIGAVTFLGGETSSSYEANTNSMFYPG